MDKKKLLKEIASWVILFFIAFSIAFLFSSKAYAKVIVKERSMENTLFENQHMMVDIIGYSFKGPQRGDIVTFFTNEEKGNLLNDLQRYIDGIECRFDKNKDYDELHERYVKRVIGIEGDVIDIQHGSVYVNGEKIEEDYAIGETLAREVQLPIKVGKDKLFVLGDNREVSIDSREFGLIDVNQIEGKVILRVYPFKSVGKVK
ncbi:signal peptidase I [Mobilitalea sibirica]|uniref:Signal peptidase I n=1 Tax=Mobilitalea sibirica TaxID=1462919 RepID=A0A8J7H1E5_9FIRM|nr:signal peptidase I [Mobilitalea sibirica]MBH1940183.1 signal peptidase I [Mobilitalea sibirica]